MKTLIIPDVHGRVFWKEAIEKHKDKVNKIIFLGDYLDPYPWEGITRKEAIRNFQEIINFKIENKDKVILLLGNHDFPYIDKHKFYSRCRYDSSNSYHIEEIFNSHKSLFQLAYEETIGEKHILFTHAGLQKGWYENHKKLIGELTVDGLNHLQDISSGIVALCEATRIRGGWERYASIVWNDVTETPKSINDELPWNYQVFGHSQQEEHPIITDEFACLDCRKAFIINDEGYFVPS
jgi:predicted phosphodiesterase